MADEPRQNERMLNHVERSYEKALYSGDCGMWTVIEIVRRPILKAPSEFEANKLIARLEKGDK